jgi:hypothetical protein
LSDEKMLFTLLIVVCSLFAFGQQVINVEDAAKYVGDSVTVCTKIFGARYFESSKGRPLC